MRQLITVALLANATVLMGCGSKSGSASADSARVAAYVSPSASAPASTGGGSAPVCFTAADVKSALGFDARSLTGGMRHYGTIWNCGFAATDPALPGVTVSATISPGTEADSIFRHITRSVKTARGASAEPDVLQLGDRGLAYGSLSHSVAAAVANGRLYSVDVMYGATGRGFGDRKDGAVLLLRKLMGA